MTADELRKEEFLCRVFTSLEGEAVIRCAEKFGEAADEIERLRNRVAELELPMDKLPEVERRDGHILGACPLCGAACLIGEYDE